MALSSVSLRNGCQRILSCIVPVSSLQIALSIPTWLKIYSCSALVDTRSVYV